MKQEPIIIKYSGEKVPFSEEKFRASLQRAGASGQIIEKVTQRIRSQLRDGMTTRELHQRTRHILQTLQHDALSGRYDLKQALIRLGPTGFPFEKYVAHIFQAKGYATAHDVEVQGHCVWHEVDVVAKNAHERIMVECKFHQAGGRCSVQTALYVKARFDDIQEACQKKPSCGPKYTQCWLVTNTKFTTTTIQYGLCRGLELLAWSYPEGKGLERLVEQYELFPITCLPALSFNQIQELTRAGIVLCKELASQKSMLRRLNVSEEQVQKILKQSSLICHPE